MEIIKYKQNLYITDEIYTMQMEIYTMKMGEKKRILERYTIQIENYTIQIKIYTIQMKNIEQIMNKQFTEFNKSYKYIVMT